MASPLELSHFRPPGVRQEPDPQDASGHQAEDLPKRMASRGRSTPCREQDACEELPSYQCQEVRQCSRQVRSVHRVRRSHEVEPRVRGLGVQALTGLLAVLAIATALIEQHSDIGTQVQGASETIDPFIGSLGILKNYNIEPEALQHLRPANSEHGGIP